MGNTGSHWYRPCQLGAVRRGLARKDKDTETRAIIRLNNEKRASLAMSHFPNVPRSPKIHPHLSALPQLSRVNLAAIPRQLVASHCRCGCKPSRTCKQR